MVRRASKSLPRSTSKVSPWWRLSAAELGLAALAFVAYAATLSNGFTYDDKLVITGAPLMKLPQPFWSLFSGDYFMLSRESTYRPVVTLTYLLDDAVSGLSPGWCHFHNVCWHVAVVVAVARLARALVPLQGEWVAPVAAGLFAVHPAISEAVENASFREDLLATFFCLLVLLAFLEGTARRWKWGFVFYTVALFAKESALALPGLWVLLRLGWPEAQKLPAQRRMKEWVGLGVITTAFLLIRYGMMRQLTGYGAGGEGSLFSFPIVFLHDLKLFVWPWPLSAEYRGVLDLTMRSVRGVASVLGVGLFAVGVWFLWKKERMAALGLAWFAVALGPVSNVIPLPIFAAERFLYLPWVGLCLATGALLGRARLNLGPSPRRVLGGVSVAWGLVLLAGTQSRHGIWRDDLTLWGRTSTDHPGAWAARRNYATALWTAGRSQEALPQLEAALQSPLGEVDRATVENMLGIVYVELKQLEQAVRVLRDSVRRRPGGDNTQNLGVALYQQGNLREATEQWELALRYDPFDLHVMALLAISYRRGGELGRAEEILARAVRIDPHHPEILAQQEALSKVRAKLEAGHRP